MYRILNSDPAPLAALVPDLDPEIARIVERAMRKEADQRYQSLDDMREDLATVRRRLEGSDTAPAPDVDALTTVEPRSAADGQFAAHADAGPALPGACACRRRARFHTGGARGARVLRSNARLRLGERAEAARSRCPSRIEATRDRRRDRGRRAGWSDRCVLSIRLVEWTPRGP